ncbi:magnesium transporter [Candidatus Sneabacter namystus]|uniref:Magnesium transporter n=1 Tax=Candidatus Sneabacter namystus TaxID=2601646 RepID=A0A5C0UIG4_9RICK|nr:magnesium transporter [Candidatus Sneabacter namystus]QEK39579.1 magnesium transporter [Candidatus Sneabacter namystus]
MNIEKYNADESIRRVFFLLKSGRYNEAREILLTLHYADIAAVLDQVCEEDEVEEFLRSVVYGLSPDTIACLDRHTFTIFLDLIGPHKVASLLDKLDLADAIEIVSRFNDPKMREEIIGYCSGERPKDIALGLSYLDKTVGRVMDRAVFVFADTSIKDTLDVLVKQKLKKRMYAVIVVDAKYKPVASVSLINLIRASNKNKAVSEIADTAIQVVTTNTDLDRLSYLFKQYGLDVIPVVNKLGKVVGMVSIDDMIKIVAQEVEEDVMHLGGVHQLDRFAGFVDIVKGRLFWLILNLVISGVGYTLVVGSFVDTIERTVIISAILPVIASMSGNAGTQVMTITVRSLASIGSVKKYFFSRVISKELSVAFFNSIALAPIGSLFLWLLYRKVKLSLLFGLSLAISSFLAGILGFSVPIMFKMFKIDPAASSGVVVTNLTDWLSHLSMLLLVYYFLF